MDEKELDAFIKATVAAALKAEDVSPEHHVNPDADPMAQLRQMQRQHAVQLERERELMDMGAKLETLAELDVWLQAVQKLPVDTVRVAESVPYWMRASLPKPLQDAIGERVRARMGYRW